MSLGPSNKGIERTAQGSIIQHGMGRRSCLARSTDPWVGLMEVSVVRSSKIFATLLVIAGSLIMLAGCARGVAELDGTDWVLDVWTISSVGPRDVPITAQFAGGHISGSVGASTYSGSYRTGPGAAFSAGPVGATGAAGSEAAARAETAYLALLRQAKSFKMTDAKLTLYDEFGNESMDFAVENK
jgi:heat shock protein HslJ